MNMSKPNQRGLLTSSNSKELNLPHYNPGQILKRVVKAEIWKKVIGTSALLVGTAALLQNPAYADDRMFIEIKAAQVGEALKKFALQTDNEILFTAALVKDKTTKGVSGEYTEAEALEMILEGTGLTANKTEDNVYLVEVDTGIKGGKKKSVNDSLVQYLSSPNSQKRNYQDLIEEITVTGQKRGEQNIQDVPILISVLSGSELDGSSFEGVNEALKQVPGLFLFSTFQGGGTKISMRGVTSNSSLFDGSGTVGYYLDEIPFAFVKFPITPDAGAYDLEQVEVLRGPQGTLYGANALNGVIRILTKDADLDKFEFKARSSLSNTKDGSDSYRGDMAINVPLVPGKLAARAVIGYNDQGGWVDKSTEKDANDAEIGNYRLKFNAEPTDALAVEVSAWYSRDKRGAPSASGDDRFSISTLKEPITTDYDAYNLLLSYEFPTFNVMSATSHIDLENIGSLDLQNLGLGSIITEMYANLTTEELRITSTSDGLWKWSLGAMYRDAEDRRRSILPDLFPSPVDNHNISESIAVFGEIDRSFLEGKLGLTLGLRYFEDKFEYREASRFDGTPPENLISSDKTFDAVTPRVVLTWYPNEDLTVYGSYSQGFRSGFELNGSIRQFAPTTPPVEEDVLTNYELGAKGTLLNNYISFDTAIYYIDWKDTQQTLWIDIGGGVVDAVALNGEDASGIGVDFGVNAYITQSLNIGLSLSWNDLTIDGDMNADGVVIFEKGDRLDESPKTTVGLTVNYNFPFGKSGYEGKLSASSNYHTEQIRRDTVGAISESDSILNTKLSFSINAPKRWSATLYADNINDEDGIVRTAPGFPQWSSRIRPRTVGLIFEYQY